MGNFYDRHKNNTRSTHKMHYHFSSRLLFSFALVWNACEWMQHFFNFSFCLCCFNALLWQRHVELLQLAMWLETLISMYLLFVKPRYGWRVLSYKGTHFFPNACISADTVWFDLILLLLHLVWQRFSLEILPFFPLWNAMVMVRIICEHWTHCRGIFCYRNISTHHIELWSAWP